MAVGTASALAWEEGAATASTMFVTNLPSTAVVAETTGQEAAAAPVAETT